MKLFTKEQNLSEYNFSTFSHTFEWKPILNSELSTKVCPAGCTLQCTRPQRKILMIWSKLKKNEIFRRGKICAFLNYSGNTMTCPLLLSWQHFAPRKLRKYWKFSSNHIFRAQLCTKWAESLSPVITVGHHAAPLSIFIYLWRRQRIQWYENHALFIYLHCLFRR